MRFAIFPALLALGHAAAVKRQQTCSDPVVRKEWRTLTDTEKTDYIDAVKCLKDTGSRLGTVSTSLYDDFAYIHRSLDTQIHNVAGFLPWHRWFIILYEQALQDCGYSGNAVYWNWEEDYSSPLSAPVFDTSDLGFGGSGATGTSCVTNGAFAGWQVSTPNAHCLQRTLTANPFRNGAPSVVNEVVGLSAYNLFHPALENGPHLTAHGGLGGDMGRNYSPNDPIFFLHHTNIDRIWWRWQSENSTRFTEYSGRRYQNDATTTVTLNDLSPMVSGFAATNVPVSDVIWAESGILCYTY